MENTIVFDQNLMTLKYTKKIIDQYIFYRKDNDFDEEFFKNICDNLLDIFTECLGEGYVFEEKELFQSISDLKKFFNQISELSYQEKSFSELIYYDDAGGIQIDVPAYMQFYGKQN